MKLKKAFVSCMFAMAFVAMFVAGNGAAEERNPAFSSYGTGPIEVRIYADYFCPPCRAMEPLADSILKDLLKKNMIRLSWVDAPFHVHSALFARYFLYAQKANRDLDHSFKVRGILFEAATDKSVTSQERIEAIFKEKEIPYEAFDVKPVFNRYNTLLGEDKINQTPTCVIIKNGQKKSFVGGPDIINALKSLQ